jgi:hypothetical protein
VVDFNQDTAKAIFQGSYKNHFLLFLSAEVWTMMLVMPKPPLLVAGHQV